MLKVIIMSWNLEPRKGKYSKKPWHQNAWFWFKTSHAAKYFLKKGRDLKIPTGDFKLTKMIGPHVTESEQKRKYFRITVRLEMVGDSVTDKVMEFVMEMMSDHEFQRYQVPV